MNVRPDVLRSGFVTIAGDVCKELEKRLWVGLNEIIGALYMLLIRAAKRDDDTGACRAESLDEFEVV